MSRTYSKQSKISPRWIYDFFWSFRPDNVIRKEVTCYKFQPGSLFRIYRNRLAYGYKEIYDKFPILEYWYKSFSEWTDPNIRWLDEDEYYALFDLEIRHFIESHNILVPFRIKKVVGQKVRQPHIKVETVKRFVRYKAGCKIKPYRDYRGWKADRREANRGWLFKQSDKIRFDIDTFSGEHGCHAHMSPEALELEQYDIQQDMEYYYGISNLNNLDESILEELAFTPSPRAKTTSRQPIWDDHCSTGIIKERRSRKFKQSIKYKQSYIA